MYAKNLLLRRSLIRRQGRPINKRGTREIHSRIKQLKKDMEEISTADKGTRERQRQVREKFEAIEAECQQIRKEIRDSRSWETRELLRKETEAIGTYFRFGFVVEMSKTGREEKEKGSSIFSQIRKLLGRQQEPQE